MLDGRYFRLYFFDPDADNMLTKDTQRERERERKRKRRERRRRKRRGWRLERCERIVARYNARGRSAQSVFAICFCDKKMGIVADNGSCCEGNGAERALL